MYRCWSVLTTVFLLVFILIRGVIQLSSSVAGFDKTVFMVGNDSESKLAMGRRLYVGDLEEYDLQLIPQISPRVADEILEKRGALTRQAILSSALEQKEILKTLKGIGDKKSIMLDSKLRLLPEFVAYSPEQALPTTTPEIKKVKKSAKERKTRELKKEKPEASSKKTTKKRKGRSKSQKSDLQLRRRGT